MEPLRNSIHVSIDEGTKVASARRAAHDLCVRLELDADVIARAELIAVELANNILQHARAGQIFFSPCATAPGLEIVAADQGPGMQNVALARGDGYSTGSTPGHGLGAIQRLAQVFDIFSAPGKGTIAAATVGSPALGPCFASVLSTPIPGESVNGDGWAIRATAARTIYFIADGLGHGHYAHEASSMATEIFLRAIERDPEYSLSELLNRMHTPMRSTRGAAIALFAVDNPEGLPASRLSAVGCGVGNVSCMLQARDGSTRSLASHNGTVGHQMRRVQEFPFLLDAGTLLIMHSDGLSTHWKLSQYPGLERRSPAVIAGLLYREAARSRDDATVLVARLCAVPAEPTPEQGAHA
jgi:anti-sigma regulatory factor (Ser/Thr protein kinase)